MSADITDISVKKILMEITTNIMIDRSSEVKQEFLHFSVIKMSGILGKTNTGDIILKHMITYLNDKHNTRLRAEFYNTLPDVVSSIGINGHSGIDFQPVSFVTGQLVENRLKS